MKCCYLLLKCRKGHVQTDLGQVHSGMHLSQIGLDMSPNVKVFSQLPGKGRIRVCPADISFTLSIPFNAFIILILAE